MFVDEQEDTRVDLSAHTIMWAQYMKQGRQQLAGGDSTSAIKLFTLADNTVSRTKDLARQAESLTWLIMAYNSRVNSDCTDSLLSRLMGIVEELDARRPGCHEQRLHAIALRAEMRSRYNEAAAAYSWLLVAYQQRGLHSADPEVLIMLRKSEDMSILHEQHERMQPLLVC